MWDTPISQNPAGPRIRNRYGSVRHLLGINDRPCDSTRPGTRPEANYCDKAEPELREGRRIDIVAGRGAGEGRPRSGRAEQDPRIVTQPEEAAVSLQF